MPTYEYTCKACGANFDIVQSFSDKPLKKHPGDCGGPVQKVFHASGIVFKGSGFYVTDSRGASSVKTAADSSTSSDSGASKSSKSDSKSSSSKSSKSEAAD
jgi:putative FmdB family regulatory protein